MARRGELAQPHPEAEEGEREHDRRAGAREREPAAGAVEHVDEAFRVVPRGDVPDDEAPQPPRHADDRIAPHAPDAGTAVRDEPLLPEAPAHAERGRETREAGGREP